MEPLVSFCLLFFLLLFLSAFTPIVRSGDAEALLALKSTNDPLNSLPWRVDDVANVCNWEGVKECMNSRVTKLVLESYNLSGVLDERNLNQLDQLRVLSFKRNSFSGQIPDLSGLANLKSLYLSDNNFSGNFPESLSGLHRLKIIVLAGNSISGEIPTSLLNLRRLYLLYLQDNQLTGEVPSFNQTSLRFFNVSNNHLSGSIPVTPTLVRFSASSFSGNADLCGDQIGKNCNANNGTVSPAFPNSSRGSSKSKSLKIWKIVGSSIGAFLVLLIVLILFWVLCKKCGRRKIGESANSKKGVEGVEDVVAMEATSGGSNNNAAKPKQGGFSWDNDGLGNLVFCGAGDQKMNYLLEDLLKASAETLGRGTMGSTYKAVMESGFIVTVKRLKDARYPGMAEFRRQMDALGRLRHSNLVPIRAYFLAKEERLLVYDYFPNGSLFSLIHGSKTSGGGKPLHWTSCLKIAEDLAAGLLYIHQTSGLTHGNLKSSNVLLGSDFESCLTDYGLTAFRDPDCQEEHSATSLFYRAPECRDIRKPPTQQADIYSFGVLLLELLTGKTPFQDLVQEYGSDIPRWVKSIREEETESGDEPTSSGNEVAEEKLGALLNIAMACVALAPDNRPAMKEVLKMIRNTRAEAQISSNSSDHSPGRWSDTIQSLPREEHLSI